MAVTFGSEPEVTHILRRVLRLHHRAQHHAVDEGIERVPFEGAKKLLIVEGGDLRGVELDVDARFGEELYKVLRLLFGRALVHAVDKGHLLFRHERGDRLVGEHHELFDELVRDGALVFGDDDLAVHIQNFRLFEVHRDAALRGARVLQNFRKAHRRVDHLDKVGVLFHRLLVALIELGDFGVRHAVAGADDGGGDAALYDLAAPIDLHEAGEGEPFHALVEGADAVGEGGRQHGQHAVGEVDARPALERLLVEDAVPRHIVRHVRDMHAQREDTVLFGNGDGVVDVARVLAVDGDDELPAKIEAAP